MSLSVAVFFASIKPPFNQFCICLSILVCLHIFVLYGWYKLTWIQVKRRIRMRQTIWGPPKCGARALPGGVLSLQVEGSPKSPLAQVSLLSESPSLRSPPAHGWPPPSPGSPRALSNPWSTTTGWMSTGGSSAGKIGYSKINIIQHKLNSRGLGGDFC